MEYLIYIPSDVKLSCLQTTPASWTSHMLSLQTEPHIPFWQVSTWPLDSCVPSRSLTSPSSQSAGTCGSQSIATIMSYYIVPLNLCTGPLQLKEFLGGRNGYRHSNEDSPGDCLQFPCSEHCQRELDHLKQIQTQKMAMPKHLKQKLAMNRMVFFKVAMFYWILVNSVGGKLLLHSH